MKLVGIQRDEFLFPSSSVTVEMPTAMDAEAAQRAIGVAREDNAVKVGTQGKKATWSPSDALLPGRHVFQVGPRLSKSGEEIAPEVAIPFQFVQTAAKVPRDVAVESMVRLRITANGPERLPLYMPTRGKYIEIMKGVNRRTRAPVSLAFNEQGRRVDDSRLLKQAEQARAKRVGKLNEDLQKRLQAARPDEMVHVAVWAEGVREIGPEEKRELEREVTEEVRMPQAALERNKAGVARAGVKRRNRKAAMILPSLSYELASQVAQPSLQGDAPAMWRGKPRPLGAPARD